VIVTVPVLVVLGVITPVALSTIARLAFDVDHATVVLVEPVTVAVAR
jgi:hypothetical protein